jgi:alkanesulfonate monooxygenase SsuD/methylene tetrahydromethanopterin reductase-like flavin-dependent oxidoreductase (luciferase family)
MKISLLTDGSLHGMHSPTYSQKYGDVIREAVLADELGFWSWGTSETRFMAPDTTISAPDSIYGAVAALTERIKIRYAALGLPFHHPITVAERLATLDAVSGGRAELATARGNNGLAMDVWGIDPKDTRAMWAESLQIIATALMNETLSYEGAFWTLNEVRVNPTTTQKPMPRLYSVASGLPSHTASGELGIGVLTWDSYFGWDYLDECFAAYRDGLTRADPVGGRLTDEYMVYVTAVRCAERREDAVEAVKNPAFRFADLIIRLYEPFASAPTYEHFPRVRRVMKQRRNIEGLMEIGPSVVAGTPDDVIEVCKQIEAMGCEEVTFNIDGGTHEAHMETIRLIGEYVIPELGQVKQTTSSHAQAIRR